MLQPDEITRVLVVTAHPDDVDFGSAGTVATLTDRGVHVAYCIVTDGQAGGFDRDVPRTEMPRIRREEQRAAAALVGVDDVTFLGRVDGEVVNDLALTRDISRRIRVATPDLVITASPERNYDRIGASHPDHRAVGAATLDAVYPFARNPFAYPELLDDEGLEPHIVREVWMQGHPTADHAVDVTDVLERKFAAILAHESQMTDVAMIRERVGEWTAGTAAEHGLPEGRHAEGYRRMFIQ